MESSSIQNPTQASAASPFLAAPPKPGPQAMLVFISVIAVSAFLLFQVQPVIARYILPWYGGSPAVWTACLLFFQVGLLAGYAYAHGLVTFLREKRKLQVVIHLTLLVLTLFLLPITPSVDLKPDGSAADPVAGIVRLLALTVGLPYLMLSATGPLVQHWFSEVFPTRSPYRLYAISNLGSLLGLITYPFLFEPLLKVSQQTMLWSAVFAAYALLAMATAFVFLRRNAANARMITSVPSPTDEESPGTARIAQWIAYSACGSILLLALTSQMCQDVAVIPFLWVVPLSLYLLTFVIAFDHARWYFRPLAIPLAMIAIGITVFLMNRQFADDDWPLGWQIATYCSAVFFSCLICHGEVVRLKPGVRHLTGFYLAISFGGAIGGLFVSLAAPFIFTGYWELHLAFALLSILTSISLLSWLMPLLKARCAEPGTSSAPVIASAVVGAGLWLTALAALALGLRHHVIDTRDEVIAASRGFYGVLQVTEESTERDGNYRSLYHGRINHGRQYMAPRLRRVATTYFGVKSGVGTAFAYLPERRLIRPTPIHAGIIGLGVGTIATYGLPGDRFRFYEINPQVEDFARSHFSYLSECDGEETVVLGDGRISLERELASGENQQFDILVVDAFSGDSIPIHLLTREAFELYFKHLKTDGVLAVHITNRHLDLSDPIRNIAASLGWVTHRVAHDPGSNGYYSDWILIANDPEFISSLRSSRRVCRWEHKTPKPTLWTDDYSNLFDVIR